MTLMRSSWKIQISYRAQKNLSGSGLTVRIPMLQLLQRVGFCWTSQWWRNRTKWNPNKDTEGCSDSELVPYPLLHQQVSVLQLLPLGSTVGRKLRQLRNKHPGLSSDQPKHGPSEVRGQNLSSQGLHAGLQVSEQVEALVEEGELSVHEGEHLNAERNLINIKYRATFVPLLLQSKENGLEIEIWRKKINPEIKFWKLKKKMIWE